MIWQYEYLAPDTQIILILIQVQFLNSKKLDDWLSFILKPDRKHPEYKKKFLNVI